jgi:poly(3-hydroxybutyrate) depolymerase
VELKLPESENKASAYVPETYNSSIRYGVVLWLGGKNVPEEKTLLARWKPVCDRHDLIFVSPRRADPRRWTSRDLAFVKDFLAELETKYPVDPSRIVVGGQAEGGMLGYLLAFRERPLVRAVIAVDAPLPTAPPDNEPVYPLVFFIARARKSEFAEAVEKGIARLRQMQYPVTVQDLGDEPRDLSAEELASVGRWIDALDRI